MIRTSCGGKQLVPIDEIIGFGAGAPKCGINRTRGVIQLLITLKFTAVVFTHNLQFNLEK